MKLGLNTSLILLLFLVVCLFSFNAYKDKTYINEELKNISLETSRSLASLILSYQEANTKKEKIDKEKLPKDTDANIEEEKEKNVFEDLYTPNNSNFQAGMIKINKKDKKVLSQNIKDYINYFQKHKEAKYFFKTIGDGRYFFGMPTKNVDENNNPYIISINIDNSDLKETMLKDFWIESLKSFFILFFYIIASYFVFKRHYKYAFASLKSVEKKLTRQMKIIVAKDEEIKYKQYHDYLTNLPNRNQLIEDLENNEEKLTIALVNLDNFKEINDIYGYEIGDEVIISFAGLLKLHSLDFAYTVYKVHADEYALLWNHVKTKIISENINELLRSIKKFSVITEDEDSIEVTATIGIASGVYEENILAHADMVLKRAKSENLSYLFFNPNMSLEREYKEKLKWTKKIRTAIKNDKMIPYCQPIVNLEDKKIRKYEILVRMMDGVSEIVSPYYFLETAKRNKLYSFITMQVIEKAFDFFNNTEHRFSVNISILDILNPATVSLIISRIKKFSNPKNITFEILESEGIENYDKASEFIQKVKDLGCKIAIDDFGSGYSNFEHILKLKVDLIKIDASLIKNIDTNENAQTIVKAIVNFANSLGIQTCAEFVHNKAVYDALRKIGTTYIQGYYISEPFPLENIKS